MPKWEYMAIENVMFDQDTWNAYGADGWELCANRDHDYIFKRPVEEVQPSSKKRRAAHEH